MLMICVLDHDIISTNEYSSSKSCDLVNFMSNFESSHYIYKWYQSRNHSREENSKLSLQMDQICKINFSELVG